MCQRPLILRRRGAVNVHCVGKTCGVYTFHQRRTDPSVYAVNIGYFDDVDGTAFHDEPTADGVSLPLVSQ